MLGEVGQQPLLPLLGPVGRKHEFGERSRGESMMNRETQVHSSLAGGAALWEFFAVCVGFSSPRRSEVG